MPVHEGELFKEKIEVNLDGRQIFSLFCGGAVITALVFVLGVTVGRRVEAREHSQSAGAAGAVDPLAALDQQAAAEGAGEREPDLAFASTLRGGDEGDLLGAVDASFGAPARGKLLAAAKPGLVAADDDEPAPRAEPKPAAPAPKLVPDAAAKVAAPAPKLTETVAKLAAPAPKLVAAAVAASEAKAMPKPEVKAEVPAARPELKSAALPKAEAAEPADKKTQAVAPAQVSPDAARFTLHLQTFSSRSEADGLAARLRKAGYQPYVVEGSDEEKGTVFRVRVGHFASFDDAVAGKADFEKKQSIIAYVTRTKK